MVLGFRLGRNLGAGTDPGPKNLKSPWFKTLVKNDPRSSFELIFLALASFLLFVASALNPSTTFFLYSGFKRVVLGFMAGALLGAPRPKP